MYSQDDITNLGTIEDVSKIIVTVKATTQQIQFTVTLCEDREGMLYHFSCILS